MRLITILQLLRQMRETSSKLLDVDVHPGLIVLRESGLSRDEQWRRIQPVVEYVQNSGDKDFLLNKLIEIAGTGRFETREIPSP
jgi:hypothetical protein